MMSKTRVLQAVRNTCRRVVMLSDAVQNSVMHAPDVQAWARQSRIRRQVPHHGDRTRAEDHRSEPRWCIVDRALREIASRRAALDAEEARWLREAEALQIWRPLGMVSAIDYLERVLGYAP